MEYNNLLELIKTVSESNISGFQYEDGDTRIVIATGENTLPGCAGETGKAMMGSVPERLETNLQDVAESIPVKQEQKAVIGNIIKSPLVGTFYTAPAEDAEVFVKVGDRVKKGQTLAIVEAMKLMNDIESEYEGVVSEVFVKNGDMVEYGQPLFAIG
ncbi:MAG: acetyl-CoA carboxylase biotin carboxyl carrier protein [Lachnospiraceae bacterium]|nr:acetyl-CoA carboxylase biotin carboxyl carrier protein [Lachnospiraceae bacterium]